MNERIERFTSYTDLAKRLCCSRMEACRRVREGELRLHVSTKGGLMSFDAADLDAFRNQAVGRIAQTIAAASPEARTQILAEVLKLTAAVEALRADVEKAANDKGQNAAKQARGVRGDRMQFRSCSLAG